MGEKLSTHWTRQGPGPIATKGYRSWVEEQIEEARARGDFDNLPGKGQPLDLSRDPFAERDWLVHHVLRNARVLPEWIELDREIREGIRWLKAHPGHPERAARVRELNRRIDRFNLLVPSVSLQKPRLPEGF
ncbi:DnaJ family domain-containing protein [Caldinitratiruptor microaerophilus]|uniref:DnaJ homologue subfamily C member 28 conserved domain-containing protein n=1 Tax=Caldinitratiruptor microaerophilus TaxID=671077 RepID=A0AA35CJ11_9FIRM|nr:DUF1992 domain-containing protein [Caldinitratiruptor microaerophilus]BDG59962.1 hypothetical protein caldi_10520 [Caldinitratiruptor microaerophilus]